MCNAKEFWMKEGEKKGEKKGESKGEKKGMKKGIKQGIQKGIDAMIASLQEMNITFEEIVGQLQKRFQLSRREAMRQVQKTMV